MNGFFDTLIGFFETIVNFVLKFFEMLLFVITFIAQGFAYVVGILAYLPPWVLPFCLAVIGFSVVMFIINR